MAGLSSCWMQEVCQRWQLPLLDGKVVFWHTAGLGPRAAAILHLHYTSRQPHLHGRNMVPPIRRWHTIVHGHWHDVTNHTGDTLRLHRCRHRMVYQKRRFNLTKTGAIVTGTRQQIAKLDQSDRVMICGAAVPFGSTLWVLGETRDSEHTFNEHITVVVHAFNFHPCAIHQI